MLTLVMLIIFCACLAMLINQGLWSNTITLINTITAGLLAMNFFEPVARLLEGMNGQVTYFLDFAGLWLVFVLSFTILRNATDYVSRTNVRFKKPVEIGGGWFVAAWTSWVLVGFTLTTLHTAPLARNFFWGSFQPAPRAKMVLGLAPDRQWLAFVHSVSQGALATSAYPAAQEEDDDDEPELVNTFDPRAEFVLKYAERRAIFEQQEGNLVTRD